MRCGVPVDQEKNLLSNKTKTTSNGFESSLDTTVDFSQSSHNSVSHGRSLNTTVDDFKDSQSSNGSVSGGKIHLNVFIFVDVSIESSVNVYV
jgi:hypothetical protein